VALLPLADAAPGSAGTLDRVRQAGKLTLGYRADARPFSYRDESGKAAGYSVALCERIAEQVKAELGLSTLAVDWVPVTIEGRFRAVQEGRIDLLCGADTATLARRKEVAFSIPIFPGGIGALLRADSSRRLREILSKGEAAPRPLWRASPAQILEQQTFSVVAGTTSESWLAERRDTLKIPAKVTLVESYDAGIQRVLERSTNVFFGDRAILLDAAKRSPSARNLIVLDRHFTYEPIALALKRGDEDFRLAVDRTLSRLFRSKEFGDLYAKWFGKPDENVLTFFRWSVLPE
jgi:ABC-type amino acid transport substrate-binding protein